MLNLLYGVSGSGKTEYLTECIKTDIQNGKRCFLLVPEQQAYISEFEVPEKLPKNARLYFEVVHFSGLAEKIFRQYGGLTRESLQGGLRSLLMWDTLRTLSPLFKEYRYHAAKDSGLTSLMLGAVNELRMNGITPEVLEAAADQLSEGDALKNKLYDIAMIAGAYTEKMQQSMGSDLPDRLLRMAQKLEHNNFFAGCNVYIDSFTSFTMQEYRVLREILRQADEVTLSLCADGFSTKLPHFTTPVNTGIRFLRMASDVNVPVKKKQLFPKNTEKKPALSILERDLWRFNLRKNERENLNAEEQSAVTMLSCANIYEESEAAALQILELAQSGIHYGEIAVVVRDTEAYRGVLDAAMERYKIPFFMSERTDLSSKPLSRLILSALRAISRGYQQQDVITLIKTGLAGVSFSDAAMFEEYCETWHIHGSRFTDEVWSMNPDGLTTEKTPRGEAILAAANRTRRTVMEPLQRLSAAMRQSKQLSDRCRDLYDYLCELSVATKLSERAKLELMRGEVREAGETLRLYRFITNTLTSLTSFLPDTELNTDEFILALTMIFSETDLGSVPNTHDCVIVGSANTLRVEKIKATLLLGLCEGEFPLAVTDSGILSERDKKALEERFGIILDSGESIRSSEELLYVYRAITKPTERLILSTVRADPDGSQKTPSLAFTRVAYLLDRSDPICFDLERVKQCLGTDIVLQNENCMSIPPIKSPVTLHLSHTKLNSFLQCPYKYYSTYCLKLREPKDSRPSYSDDGLFLHYVFEHFLRHSLGEDGKLHIPQKSEIEPLADQIIDSYLSKVCPIDSAYVDRHLMHLFARLRKLALIILQNILAELEASKFVPYRFEQIIGMPGENGLPAPTWNLPNGSVVALSGKIDRVDLYDDGESLYLRVVDYKSGKHDFKLENVASGLDIQLVLYLFAALSPNGNRALPAGSQYLYAQNVDGKLTISRSGFFANEPAVKEAWELEKGSFTKGLKPTPMDEVRQLEQQMKDAVLLAAERILAGEAQKTPSQEACRLCPIRNACEKAYHE